MLNAFASTVEHSEACIPFKGHPLNPFCKLITVTTDFALNVTKKWTKKKDLSGSQFIPWATNHTALTRPWARL